MSSLFLESLWKEAIIQLKFYAEEFSFQLVLKWQRAQRGLYFDRTTSCTTEELWFNFWQG